MRDHFTGTLARRADFPRLGFLLAHIQALLNLLGKRVSANGHVARECAGASGHDVDVAESGADVDDGDRLLGNNRVVGLVGILDGEGGHIHDHWLQLGLANDHAVVGDDFLLGRHQQKLHLASGATLAADQLVINLHVVLGEGDVVLGFPRNLLLQFLGCHGRDLDLLDDDGVSRDGGGHLFAFDPEVVAQRLDGLDHGGLVHDRAVDDGLRR